MSWSISAVGKASKVSGKITGDLNKIKCQEPEQSIKDQVGYIIIAALAAYPENVAVKVEASGSQWQASGKEEAVNNLNLKIEPLYGFVE